MQEPRLYQWIRAFAQPVTYLGVAMIVVVWSALVFTANDKRETAYEDALRDGTNLARVFAEYVSRTIKSTDNALIFLRKIRQADPSGFDLKAWVGDRSLRTELAYQFSIADADGFLTASTAEFLAPNTDISGRLHFIALRDAKTDELFISRPLRLYTTGEWAIVLARRLTAPDGSFAGIITASIDPSALRAFYETVDLRADGFASLVGFDRVIRARSGLAGRPADEAFGRSIAEDPVFDRHRDQPAGSYWNEPGIIDSVKRLITYRVVEGFPLIAIVGLAERAVYAQAVSDVRAYFGVGVILTVAIVIAIGLGAARELKLNAATAAVAGANQRFDAALNHMSQGLAMFDRDQRVIVCNARYADMYGLAPDQVKPGTSLREIIDHRIAKGLYAGPNPNEYMRERLSPVTGASINIHALSDGRYIHISRRPMASGGWVTTHEDVTELHQAMARIAHLAHHDTLTDLANRVLFLERVERALARLREGGGAFSVFLLDLDRFKAVNDTLGHAVGDNLIKVVAQRLVGCAGPNTVVARLGGDEFAIVQMVEADQRREAAALAGEVLRVIGEPYDLDGHQVVIGTSIGIAMAPADGVEADQLMKNADLALYRAKAEGRDGYRCFETAMDLEARSRHALEIDLRTALGRDEFELFYQPVINVADRAVCGVEALVRWRHPLLGLISPDRFVPLAEETGLIVPLGEWILRRACTDAIAWPSSVKVAVNLSPAQFRKGDLVAIVARTLAETGLVPARLELEITESVLLQKDEKCLAVLHRLRDLGIAVVLDDFGTGYSSLSYLQMFPFDRIKIDKSFVADLTGDGDCAAIVCAVTGLARSLDVATTAEGVETVAQYELLRAAGCTQAQGYLFGRPQPVAELDLAAATRAAAA